MRHSTAPRVLRPVRLTILSGLASLLVALIAATGDAAALMSAADATQRSLSRVASWGTLAFARGARIAALRDTLRVTGCTSTGPATRTGPPTRQRVVALSFDDGPWATTPSVLRIIERFRVHATFFEIGRQITPQTRPWLLRILRDGNSIGDHTWSHLLLPYQTPAAIRSQLLGTAQQIHRMTGFWPCLMRPPYGGYNAIVVRTAAQAGLRTVLWSVDPADWSRPGTIRIIRRVLAGIAPGRIILMHDGGGDRSQTVAALPSILTQLAHRHYRVVTVEALLHAQLVASG